MHFETWVEATVFVSSSTLRGSLTLSAKKSVYIWVDCFFLQIHSLYVPIWLMAWLFMGERNIIFGHHKHILEMYSLVWIGWNDSMQANFHFDFTANNKKKQFKLSGGKSIRCKSIISFHLFRWKNIKPTTCGAESPWKRMTAHMHIYEMFDMLFSSSSSICHF